jgi:Ca2+/Na+ antiporter
MKKWFAKVSTRLIILIIFVIMTMVIIIIINSSDIFLPEIVEICLCNVMK